MCSTFQYTCTVAYCFEKYLLNRRCKCMQCCGVKRQEKRRHIVWPFRHCYRLVTIHRLWDCLFSGLCRGLCRKLHRGLCRGFCRGLYRGLYNWLGLGCNAAGTGYLSGADLWHNDHRLLCHSCCLLLFQIRWIMRRLFSLTGVCPRCPCTGLSFNGSLNFWDLEAREGLWSFPLSAFFSLINTCLVLCGCSGSI